MLRFISFFFYLLFSFSHAPYTTQLTRVHLMFTYVTPALTSAMKMEDDEGVHVFMEVFGMHAGVIERWHQGILNALVSRVSE